MRRIFLARTSRHLLRLTLVAAFIQPHPADAQAPLDSLVHRLASMTAVSGYEQAMGDTLLTLLPGAIRDRAGNIVLTLGEGEPRRLVACPMDEPGFVVGGIRDDGFLTLRRAGPSPGPLADQQYEGQRVVVWGRKGALPGVVGVRSVHLTRGRPAGSDIPFTFDEAYVDVGAATSAEARRIGVDVLSPIALEKRPHAYADSLLAAPVAARRGACAALLAAAREVTPRRGTVVVAFVVEQSFTQRGLLSVARNAGPFARSILLERGTSRDLLAERPSPDPRHLGAFEAWLVPARYAGTAVETIALPDIAALKDGLVVRIRGAD